MNNARKQLDRLFSFDACFSVVFGSLSLIAPHGLLTTISGGSYNHSVHETLRYVYHHLLVLRMSTSIHRSNFVSSNTLCVQISNIACL